MDFAGLRTVVEGVLQSKPNLMCSREANNLCQGFLGEGGMKKAEKTLICRFPL